MNALKTSHLLLVAVTLAAPCFSYGSTLNISFGGTSAGNEGVVSSVPGASVITFDNGVMPANVSTTGNAQIVNGSVNNVYATPTNDTSDYLTTGIGTATVALASPSNYFGLYWGSVDTYNTIVLNFTNGTSASYTGTQIAALDNISSSGTTSAYVNFASSTPISSVELESTNYAFEADNLSSLSATPEPSTWILTAGGLGLATFLYRRRQQGQA